MKNYNVVRSSGNNKKRPKLSKKGKSLIAVSASVAVVAIALTLSLTLGLRKNDTAIPADNDIPVYVPPVTDTQAEPLTFCAPLGSTSVIKQTALNKLVYNDTLKQWRTHNGVDFAAEAGSEVFSIAPGKVERVENTILEGVVVTVSHPEGYTSVYKGLDSASVETGDSVEGGSVLGKIGTMMCEKSRGAHLHLEMKKDGAYICATDYISDTDNK